MLIESLDLYRLTIGTKSLRLRRPHDLQTTALCPVGPIRQGCGQRIEQSSLLLLHPIRVKDACWRMGTMKRIAEQSSPFTQKGFAPR